MKNFILILISIVLGFLAYKFIGRYNSNIVGPSHFQYLDCDVSYKQDYVNMDHCTAVGPYNHWLEDSAKSIFAKCLCEKYLQSKNENIKQKIFQIYNEETWYQVNFYKTTKAYDINVILKFKDRIFKNDPTVLDWIKNNYKNNKGINEFIIMKIHNRDESRYEYCSIINYMDKEKIPIDTLVKYKEIIFKIPPIYGDA